MNGGNQMRKGFNVISKTLSFLLALLLVIPTGSIPAIIVANAAGDAVAVADGELVAENYASLSDGEKALLLSDLITGSTYYINEPGDSDNLVSVDADAKTVTASEYVSGEYIWRPVAARLIHGEEAEEIALTNGVGAFEYDGNVYSIEVDYQAEISVPAVTQEKLLNGPYHLAKGVENLETINAYSANFNLVASNTTSLMRLTDGSLPGETVLSSKETINAIKRLDAQSKKNDGFLDIEMMLYDYDVADSRVGYLLESGAEFHTLAVATYNDIKQISDDEGIATILSFAVDSSTGKKIRIALNAIKTLLDNTDEAINGDWAILDADKNPLKAGLGASELATLDGLVDAAIGAEHHDDAIVNPLKTDKVTVMANVNQFNVSVVLRASYIAGTTIDSAEATPLEEHTTVIQVLEGSTPAQVEEAVAASGIEDAALSSWVDIDGTNYDRTASDLPANLAEDTEYTITYSPKMINVAYGFETELPAAVPYGYNMTLPLNENAELVYDYEIDGRAYLQGDVYRVTKSVTVNRTEGKPWNVSRLNGIVADVYAEDLTDAEESALRAVALKGENVLFRIPTNDDGLVTVTANGGGNFTVTANDYPSGIPGVAWKAVSGRAVNDGETVAEFTFQNGIANDAADNFDRIEVKYAATLTNISDDTIVAVLNTPSLLAKKVKEIKKNVDTLDSLYDQFAKLDQSSLKTIQIGVNGSEMGDDAKAAADFIVENCVNKSTSRLYLFEYLTDYRERGAALLFSDSIYESISRQTKYLTDNLNVMNDDPELLPLLTDIGYEDYSERINEILGILNDVEFPPLPDGIDGSAPDIDLLTDALIAVDTGRTYDAANRPLTLTANVIEWTSRKVTVTLDGVVFGSFDAGSKVELPALESITELGVTARFFTWSGADVIIGKYDPASSSPNKHAYSLLLDGGDVNLTSVFVYVGDVNNDGRITIQDIGAAKKLLAGNDGFDDINLEALDIDGNGLTVIRDLGLLKKLIAG